MTELAAQRGNVHIEGLGGAVPMRVPDRLEDAMARVHRARIGGEERKDVELLRGELYLGAVDGDASGATVDRTN